MQITDTVLFNNITHRRCILLFILLATLTGCINQPSSDNQPEDGFLIEQHTTTFFATTPTGTLPDSEIYLDIVDEVTGVNLNPIRHKMNYVSENLYSLELFFPDSSLVKYRYAMGSNPTTIEHDSLGEPIHYRVFGMQANSPIILHDVIASWDETPLNISLGRIEGKLIDAETGTGIPDSLVNLNGMQALSTATGEFLIENALPGKFLLTIYSMDGRYNIFQQEAVIASGASTPVEIMLKSGRTTQVTFIVTPPPDHKQEAPIKIIGNTLELGNSFTERPGATSIIAITAPTLSPQSDGTYTLTLTLPPGMDLHYKYTIGDGFWNAERHADGQYITRQLIVPNEDITIKETIANWKAGDRTPVRIEARSQTGVELPQKLFIQFNSYTWTEPLPMWKAEDNTLWLYEIYSPLYLFPSIGYRLCFDAQCKIPIILNDAAEAEVPRFPTDGSQSLIQHTLPEEATSTGEVKLPVPAPSPRSDSFVTGVELLPYYQPSAQATFSEQINTISETLPGWIILSPTWTADTPGKPSIEIRPGHSTTSIELIEEITLAHEAGLQTAIFPSFDMEPNPAGWWQAAGTPNFDWWTTWFDRYEAFIDHHVQIASDQKVEAIFLGGPQITPALFKSENSTLPDSASEYWQSLIINIRGIYSGKLIWVIDSKEIYTANQTWLKNFDAIYVLIDLPSSPHQIEKLLDEIISPLAEETNIDVILGVRYPSIQNAEDGCIQVNGACLSFDNASHPGYHIANLASDEQAQATAYNNISKAINGRSWIDGIVTRGFYFPYPLLDASNSIHGKPAEDVLMYWFSHWQPTFP